ncbi:hypothetical protein PHYC_02629 [Phycisphaerales bacterium]|nr:hypothetical protein PHYC_02629 [Phycisphaerales bacterium]
MRRPLTLAGLSLLALTLPACSGTRFANLFTFSQEKGGSLAASDSVGARMAGQKAAQLAKSKSATQTREAQAAEPTATEQAAIVR